VAAPLGGLPLFIHVPLWVVGLLLFEGSNVPRFQASASNAEP
jgi:hypothetical protein